MLVIITMHLEKSISNNLTQKKLTNYIDCHNLSITITKVRTYTNLRNSLKLYFSLVTILSSNNLKKLKNLNNTS